MRHFLFFLCLGVAVLMAIVFSFPFMMSECQLNDTQSAIDRCFAANDRGLKIYSIAALGFLALSIWLYIRASWWALAAALGIGVAPIAIVLWLASF